jgi:hypothetical protein
VLCITHQDVVTRAEQLSTERVTLDFLSPTCLKAGHIIKRPVFHVLIRRTIDRLTQLQDEYGDPPVRERQRVQQELLHEKAWRLGVAAQAETVQLIHDQTHWVRVTGHSARQQQKMPIDGFVGRAVFEGDFTHLHLRELLVWGELLRVGKNVTKGNGYYHIEVESG